MYFASCQIGALGVTAPPRTIMTGLSIRRFGGHLRDVLLGLMLALFAAVIVYGDEIPQSWVPEALTLPDDAQVQMDRAVGSSIRMFSFSTGADLNKLFGDWSAALEGSGYSIRPQQAELDQKVIEFSGHNIMNAKIATAAARNGDGVVVSFDATLK